jgi:hypothetical protein
LVFNKSLDGGNTWLASEKIITSIPGGWDYDVPGIYRANGLPVTVCDISNGPNRGTIYVNWSDQRNGVTDTDVWMVKSSDGGNTWSAIKKVNGDAKGSQQFFTWMTIDQTTGYLYSVFYDRRNYVDLRTDVYMAYSTDGGNNFTNERISENPFIPVSTVFFGDYLNITAHNNIVRPVWSSMDANGVSSIYTALVNNPVANTNHITGNELHQNYPNPASNLTFISFKLHSAQKVSIYIYDVTGKLLTTPLRNTFMPEGRNVVPIDAKKLFLAAGTYIYTLETETEKISKLLVIQ